jgi:serine/threonine protein kinase
MVLRDWVVVDRARSAIEPTGATFSVGYVVESGETGQQAFLKALDFELIIRNAGPDRAMQALQDALTLYNFEVRVCQRCAGLDRVVTFLESGTVQIDPAQPLSLVPYLIFEQADADVRAFLEFSANLDAAWALRCMHQISIGLQQMHSRAIAHQDLKPSNVLMFGRSSSKVGDVGRAVDRTVLGPYDGIACPGASFYAAPELLYGELASDWDHRRLACDLYLLGSMLVFFFAHTTMTALLFDAIPAEVLPRAKDGSGWQGNYAGALPFLQRGFATVLDRFSAAVPSALSAELRRIVQQLCDPDPNRRGSIRARASRNGNQYDLQYYVSRFDALATRAEARVGLPRQVGQL